MTTKNKKRLKSLLKYFVLTCFPVLIMFPFVWMPLTFLKRSQRETCAFPVRYMPNPASAVNCVTMLWRGNFGRYMLNSFFSSAAAAICAVFIAILASYAISRFHSRFKNVLLLLFLVTQMILMFIMLAPLYQLLAEAKMLNDLRNLTMLYTNMMIPFSVVALCGFFDSVLRFLEETAWIDGYGYFKALSKIVVPVIIPGIAATFIFAFISSWNEFLMAVMFTDVNKLETIPAGLSGLILKYNIKWGEMAAGAVVSLIPTMCLFAFAQKYMIEGLAAGSVKS